MTSSRMYVATGAWLLAAGLMVSTGGATAFADTGSGAAGGVGSSSAAKGHDAGTGHGAGTGTSPSASDDKATTPGVTQHAGTQPTIEESDPVTKPTTVVTRNATVAIGARQFSSDITSTADPASGTDDAGTDDARAEVARTNAPRSDDATVPATDPAPPADTGPTSEVAAPFTTNDQPPPSDTPPTDDPSPTLLDSTEVTSDTTVPVTPVNDASGSGTASSGSDTGPSESTSASTAPTVVAQDASAGASGSIGTAPSTQQTPPVSGTTLLEELLTPTSAPVVPPVVPVDVTPVLDTVVADIELLAADDSAQRRADHDRPALSPLQILRLMTQTPGSSFTGQGTEIPTLLDGSDPARSDSAASAFGTSGALAGTTPSTSVGARIKPNAALPPGLETFLHSYGGIIVAVSLSAMFAAALPGLIGLAIPIAAGMGIGYRQAKAGRALRASGIAHLAPSAPIGVVRSGSLIALRPAKRRVAAASDADLAQEVA